MSNLIVLTLGEEVFKGDESKENVLVMKSPFR